MDEIVRQCGVHQPQSGLNRMWIVGGAVLTEQVLQDVDGDIGTDLDLAHQILAHHFPGEYGIGFMVKYGHGHLPLLNRYGNRDVLQDRKFDLGRSIQDMHGHR